MDALRYRDVLYRGMGRTASLLGEPYDLFRPMGADTPLSMSNRVVRLPILFDDKPTTSPVVKG